MFKYEKYITDFLLQAKEVSLEKIGLFILTDEMISSETQLQVSFQKINFQFDKKAVTSEPLLLFIAEKEQKNKLLVSLDTESYLNELRQFINTGKTVIIDGIGSLQSNNSGEYEFEQKAATTNKQEETGKKKMASREENNSKKIYDRKNNYAEKSGKNNFAKILLLLLLICAAGYGIYYFGFNTKAKINSGESTVNNDSTTDTLSHNAPATGNTVNTTANRDSVTYKFIFETTTDSGRAYSRIAQLKRFGDPASLDSIKKDTATFYKLYVVKKIIPADSAAAKDSVQKYFQRDISIEVLK